MGAENVQKGRVNREWARLGAGKGTGDHYPPNIKNPALINRPHSEPLRSGSKRSAGIQVKRELYVIYT